MKPKYLDIDFEFNQTTEYNVNLVCCAWKTNTGEKGSIWLNHDEDAMTKLANELKDFKDTHIFRSWSVVAEARSFLAMALDPVGYKWIDMFLEYRCLMNHSKLQYGRQLIDGKIHRNPQHRFDKRFKKPEENLAAVIFKLLDKQIDTEHKSFMRDVIIDGRYVEKYKMDIMNYCQSDIEYLPQLFKKIVGEYVERLPKSELQHLKKEMLMRGEYAARTAKMEQKGYPINVTATRNFAKSVGDILNDIAEDINEQFPELKPFERNKATRKYVFKQAKAKEQIIKYCEENGVEWDRTDKGDYSLSADAYGKYFQFRHDFPRDNYFAQVLRYKKTEQHMNGFKPKAKMTDCWEGTDILKMTSATNKKRKNFFHSLGSDGRVRPYFNIYGAQSARSQPGMTGYLFLKAAWMRVLAEPPKGRAMISIDWGQIQFLLKMLESRDKRGIDAYQSGDVYLYFAKQAGAVPQNATKESHSFMRDKFKNTTLGIQFLMSKYGLAIKLTNDTGQYHSEEEAQELIDLFEEIFDKAHENGYDILEEYQRKNYVKSPCGWYMWGENPNDRSVQNCPYQMGESARMRKAVALSQNAGQDVLFTNHDAIYIECDSDKVEENITTLAECMDKAFRHFLPEDQKLKLGYCKLDADVWSTDFEDEVKEYDLNYKTVDGKIKIPVKQQKLYVDKRGKKEYEVFKEYFEDRFSVHLL